MCFVSYDDNDVSGLCVEVSNQQQKQKYKI